MMEYLLGTSKVRRISGARKARSNSSHYPTEARARGKFPKTAHCPKKIELAPGLFLTQRIKCVKRGELVSDRQRKKRNERSLHGELLREEIINREGENSER